MISRCFLILNYVEQFLSKGDRVSKSQSGQAYEILKIIVQSEGWEKQGQLWAGHKHCPAGFSLMA